MTEANWWWVAAGIAVALELSSGTVYLLMLAVGLACAAVAAMLGASTVQQVLVAALFSALAMGIWHLIVRKRRAPRPDSHSNPDLLLDIGQTVNVEHWGEDGMTRVHYRGADWTARLAPGARQQIGVYVIHAIEGSQLILSN